MAQRKSIATQLSTRVGLLVALGMLLLGILIFLRIRHGYSEGNKAITLAQLELLSDDISSLYQETGDSAVVDAALLDTVIGHRQVKNVACCVLVDGNGAMLNRPDLGALAYDGQLRDSAITREEMLFQIGTAVKDNKCEEILNTADFKAKSFIIPVKNTGLHLVGICTFGSFYMEITSILGISFILFVLMAVVVILLVSATIRKKLAPLKALSDSTRQMAVSKFHADLPVNTTKTEDKSLEESVAAIALKYEARATELEKAVAEQERLEKEFHIARKIQLDLVPNVFPAFPERKDVDIYASLNPWREVGGNLYNFGITDDKLLFCIGDVSGKGILSAIFMSMTFKLISTGCHDAVSPADIIAFANAGMARGNESGMFVTMFAGCLDLKTGVLQYCNAGQDEPFLVKPDGSVTMLEVDVNMPIGLMEEAEYTEQTITLEKGTMMMLYTDGVIEAANGKGELYGIGRMRNYLEQHAKDSCEEVVSGIRSEVMAFMDSEAQDDCTGLAFRYQ